MSDRPDDFRGEAGVCDCKVGRVLERWNLAALDDDMASRWRTGDASLRTLERELNVAVVRAAARESGVATLDGEAENVYRLLTDDDVTSGMRVQARRRLENDGLDVDDLTSDFVSHQTIHNHLTGCLGVEREPDDRDPVQAAEERIRPLQSRLEAVVSDSLDGLSNGGVVTLGDHDVFTEVTVSCNECGTRRELGEFLDRGGCECGDGPTSGPPGGDGESS